jgi:hypothetical protein
VSYGGARFAEAKHIGRRAGTGGLTLVNLRALLLAIINPDLIRLSQSNENPIQRFCDSPDDFVREVAALPEE